MAMNSTTFKQLLGAVALTVAFVQAGIVNLPLDDATKSFLVFGVGIASTFLAGLAKPAP